MDSVINSTKNPIVQRFRRAAAGDDSAVLVADGVTLVAEALAARLPMREVAVSPRLESSARGAELSEQLRRRGLVGCSCSDGVLGRLSHLTTHQGVVAIVERPRARLDDMLTGVPLLLVAAGVRDPGNLGALVRTAEAAGVSGVVVLAGGADPFRDKAVRGSAGSVFRVPVVAGVEPSEFADWCDAHGIAIVVSDGGASEVFSDTDLRGPIAITLGAETGGIPAALLARADRSVAIPMAGAVDSLNVSVAAGIMLFEARRQRR